MFQMFQDFRVRVIEAIAHSGRDDREYRFDRAQESFRGRASAAVVSDLQDVAVELGDRVGHQGLAFAERVAGKQEADLALHDPHLRGRVVDVGSRVVQQPGWRSENLDHDAVVERQRHASVQ